MGFMILALDLGVPHFQINPLKQGKQIAAVSDCGWRRDFEHETPDIASSDKHVVTIPTIYN